MLRDRPILVVIAEHALPCGGLERPFLVVTSRLADEYLWVEVLNLGEHDVLAKPFRAPEVQWVLESGWRIWANKCFMAHSPRSLPCRTVSRALATHRAKQHNSDCNDSSGSSSWALVQVLPDSRSLSQLEFRTFGPYNGLLERPLSIVPLREDSVMCQFSTCPNPAAFMVCNTTGSMKALCREHLISLGVAESELPKPDGQ